MAVQPSMSDAPPSSSLKLPSSSHRLPTVSASEALRSLSDNDHGPSILSTGIANVDVALGEGFERGKVTELWGPAGAGKTAVALAAAATVLQRDKSAVWIDTTTPLSVDRLKNPATKAPDLSNFHHTTTPTLTHLLALLIHPPSTFPPPQTHLLVLTNLHACLETSHPRHAPSLSATQKWAASRRYAILGSISSALNKLAAVHNIAVIVTTGCATRSRGPTEPLGLVPGVSGSEWDAGIWTRAVVFQDFAGLRGVGVQKLRGSAVLGDQGRLAAFAVSQNGRAVEVSRDRVGGAGEVKPLPVLTNPVQPRKRAFDEVADSDEEEEGDEYGNWAEVEEDAMEAATGIETAANTQVVVTVDN